MNAAQSSRRTPAPIVVYGLAVHTFVILAALWTIGVAATTAFDIGSLFTFATLSLIVWPILGGAWTLWVALSIVARWRSLDWRILPRFVVAPMLVVVTVAVTLLMPDPLETAVGRIRTSDVATIDAVRIWADSGTTSVTVRLAPGSTFRDARSVWCDVVRPARVPRGVSVSITSGGRSRIRAWDGRATTVRGLKREIGCPDEAV